MVRLSPEVGIWVFRGLAQGLFLQLSGLEQEPPERGPDSRWKRVPYSPLFSLSGWVEKKVIIVPCSTLECPDTVSSDAVGPGTP